MNHPFITYLLSIQVLIASFAISTTAFTIQKKLCKTSGTGTSVTILPLHTMTFQKRPTCITRFGITEMNASATASIVNELTIIERQEEITEESATKQTPVGAFEEWEVRILDDNLNIREYVAACLVKVTGLSEVTAYETMMQAHNNGVAVVGRYVLELAEMYHDELEKNGIACDLVPVDIGMQ
jgi:ATP-dependent Clp protease adapter protein ClpS